MMYMKVYKLRINKNDKAGAVFGNFTDNYECFKNKNK